MEGLLAWPSSKRGITALSSCTHTVQEPSRSGRDSPSQHKESQADLAMLIRERNGIKLSYCSHDKIGKTWWATQEVSHARPFESIEDNLRKEGWVLIVELPCDGALYFRR